jgi:hypothetical protein
LRTPINLGLHIAMLALIVPALSLLASPATRAALRNGRA